MHDSTADKWLVKAPFYGWTMMIWNAEVHSEVLVRHIPLTLGDTAGEKRSFGSFGSFLRRRFPVEPSVIFANFSSVLVPLTPRHLWSSSQRSASDDMLYNEPDCRYIYSTRDVCKLKVVQTILYIYIPWFPRLVRHCYTREFRGGFLLLTSNEWDITLWYIVHNTIIWMRNS